MYTLLHEKSLQTADQLGQDNVIIASEQAKYAEALEVIWQKDETFQCLVFRMGSFHIIFSGLSCRVAIGKRFEDVGLGVIVTESGIVGSGSVLAMLEGRSHIIAYQRKEGLSL